MDTRYVASLSPDGAVPSPCTHNPTRKGCRTLAEALACTARPLKADTRSGVDAIACMMVWVVWGGVEVELRAHNPRPRHRSAVAIHACAAAPPIPICPSLISALFARSVVTTAPATCAHGALATPRNPPRSVSNSAGSWIRDPRARVPTASRRGACPTGHRVSTSSRGAWASPSWWG
jgi:hypothetical protein